jgi:hypothetical protein
MHLFAASRWIPEHLLNSADWSVNYLFGVTEWITARREPSEPQKLAHSIGHNTRLEFRGLSNFVL